MSLWAAQGTEPAEAERSTQNATTISKTKPRKSVHFDEEATTVVRQVKRDSYSQMKIDTRRNIVVPFDLLEVTSSQAGIGLVLAMKTDTGPI